VILWFFFAQDQNFSKIHKTDKKIFRSKQKNTCLMILKDKPNCQVSRILMNPRPILSDSSENDPNAKNILKIWVLWRLKIRERIHEYRIWSCFKNLERHKFWWNLKLNWWHKLKNNSSRKPNSSSYHRFYFSMCKGNRSEQRSNQIFVYRISNIIIVLIVWSKKNFDSKNSFSILKKKKK
jgi:hypothetical protein